MFHRIRIILPLVATVFFVSAKAQTYMTGADVNFIQPLPLPGNQIPVYDHPGNQQWYFSRYAGLSAGFGYFNGVPGTYVSVPFVLQINHPLNNNLTAFGAISAAPAFIGFSHSFTDPGFNKYNPGPFQTNTYQFGMNSRVEMGLMYINDAKTFSISGSIGVERSSYPIYPTNTVNRKNQK
jgi:hypothetical protein